MSRSFKLLLTLLVLTVPVGLLLRYLGAGDVKTMAGVTRFVVDGDTLYLRGHERSIRLWGVDAPEREDAGFEVATRTLRDLTRRKRVTCEVQEIDKYDRAVARCYLNDGREVNRLMVESGAAKEYFYYTLGYYAISSRLENRSLALSPPTVKVPRPRPSRP